MRGTGLTAGLIAAAAMTGGALATPEADLALDAAMDVAGGADLVVFDLPAAPGAPRVHAATLVRAAPAEVIAILLDPARYRAVIPAMVRSEVEAGTGAAARAQEKRVAWELEVPLFNLSGHLTLRPRADGVEMALTDGDLAPGRVRFRVTARADGRTTLEADAQIDVRRSSFFLRHMMARSRFGEPAALAAAIWVALRATALRAEHAGASSAFRPTAPPGPPPTWMPDGRAPGDPRLGPLWARGALALVARTPAERLAGVAVAVPVAARAETLAARLRDPRSLAAFPGWKTVIALPPVTPGAPPSAMVRDGIPFVDFDATWQGQPGPAPRWVAIAGAARGARLGWDVWPAGGATSVAVLTLHPRLERTGTIPRRLIAAEPLLEHGLALSLALVDALGETRALVPDENPR